MKNVTLELYHILKDCRKPIGNKVKEALLPDKPFTLMRITDGLEDAVYAQLNRTMKRK